MSPTPISLSRSRQAEDLAVHPFSLITGETSLDALSLSRRSCHQNHSLGTTLAEQIPIILLLLKKMEYSINLDNKKAN